MVRGIYDAWRLGDFTTGVGEGPFDADFEFEPIVSRQGLGGPLRGDEELRAVTRDWFSTWDRVWFEAERFIDAGDRVLVFASQCQQLGDSEMRARVAHVWTLRDAKAVRWQSYNDRGEAMTAAGLGE